MNGIRRQILIAVVVMISCSAFLPQTSARSLSPPVEADAALDLLLTRQAQAILDKHQLRNSRSTSVQVSASVDVLRNRLVIDFGPGILPQEDDHSLQEVEQYIRNTLEAYALKAGMEEVETVILYEGVPYSHHFPRSNADSMHMPSRRAANTVLVSASHGLLRVHPSLAWEFQRTERNGVLEDLITPGYADTLKQLLEGRGGSAVYRARRADTTAHSESMRPWHEMSARYNLKDILPERADIWNHFATSTAGDREVSDDIRARPYYANHLAVEGMLSIHTNADETGSARGSRVFYHASKPEDRELGNMALCYMREIITAQDGYGDFPVPRSASTSNHGENNFALMPSLVVEVAFHTNAVDAAALQDPAFRQASMKGLEKGYRLFRDGKDCQPLSVERITDVETPSGGRSEVEVHFKGFPQFPVTLDVQFASCQPGWTCDGGEVVITEPVESPIRFLVECGAGDGGSSRWRTTMRDDDGVKAEPVEHQQTCLGGASPGAAINSARVSLVP